MNRLSSNWLLKKETLNALAALAKPTGRLLWVSLACWCGFVLERERSGAVVIIT